MAVFEKIVKFDVGVLGLSLDIVGAIYLANSILFLSLKSKLEIEQIEWNGHSKSYIKGSAKSKWNTIIGISHIIIGFILQILSKYVEIRNLYAYQIILLLVIYFGFLLALNMFKEYCTNKYAEKEYRQQ